MVLMGSSTLHYNAPVFGACCYIVKRSQTQDVETQNWNPNSDPAMFECNDKDSGKQVTLCTVAAVICIYLQVGWLVAEVYVCIA